ncbi:MAG TPA: hypothetical protein VMA31_05920 [Bryobacteraceae bacterium]|nr:hypothetical protein [Bryobacteraceae bacterium]
MPVADGLSVTDADLLEPFKAAVIVAVCVDDSVPVEAVNDAVVALADTAMDAGTFSVPTEDDKLTELPPVGAAVASVTVQVVFADGGITVAPH